jgi:hypothetical protein
MDGWMEKAIYLIRIGEWATCSLTRTQKQAHRNKKQTPTKAMEMHMTTVGKLGIPVFGSSRVSK